MHGSYHPVTVRVQALILAYCGVNIKHIKATTGMPRQTIQYWVKKAREHGYNPEIDPHILPVYVEDGKRTGHPKEITEATKQAILESISKDQNGREKSSEILAYEASISYSSVLHILKQRGYKAVKQTTKPGLTDEMKQKRLQFCLAHKD
jgi:transposase